MPPVASQPAAAPSNSLTETLIQVMQRVTEFLEVERSTLFLYDESTRELWTPVAQGAKEIRLPSGRGIAGHVYETGETIRLNDAYADPRFQASVDKSTGFHTRDIFCRPVSDSHGRRIGVIQLLNRRHGPMSAREEALLDAICGQAGIAIENAQLLSNLQRVHGSELQLRSELEAKHGELQKAFLRIEEGATAQALLGKRVQKVRLVTMIVVVALFVAVGLFAWLGGNGKNSGANLARTEPKVVHFQTVGVGPVRTSIALLGNLEPLEILNLTAPLRGRIAEKNFRYGELVAKGQLLARIDTTDAAIDLRNVEADAFKASVALKQLENWSTGAEVVRAQRDLLKARLSFESNQRNLREMEHLSQLGIIAQGSLDSAREQFTTQESDFAAAKDALEAVLSSATPDRIRIARNELENAAVRVEDLRAKIAAAAIYAPFDAIVVLPNIRPSAARSDRDGFYEQGASINQADILLTLGNLEGVSVKAKADEVDVARIRRGQPVTITGDAFSGHALTGTVAFISSQAIITGPRPYFEVSVKTGKLTAEDLAVVRLGMTARIDISVYNVTQAMIVPVSAVRRETSGRTVVFRGGPDEKVIPVEVALGVTQPNGVEIRSGLKPGETIATDAKAVRP